MFNASPQVQKFHSIDFLHLVAGETARVVVCCEVVEGLVTHFNQRTYLCPCSDCGMCEIGRPTRYHAFLRVFFRSKHFLLRTTGAAANKLKEMSPIE